MSGFTSALPIPLGISSFRSTPLLCGVGVSFLQDAYSIGVGVDKFEVSLNSDSFGINFEDDIYFIEVRK